jgi:hypothetical protein
MQKPNNHTAHDCFISISNLILATRKYGEPQQVNAHQDKIDLVFNCETTLKLFKDKYSEIINNINE